MQVDHFEVCDISQKSTVFRDVGNIRCTKIKGISKTQVFKVLNLMVRKILILILFSKLRHVNELDRGRS